MCARKEGMGVTHSHIACGPVKAEDGALRRPFIRAIEEVEPENLDLALGGFHATDDRRGIRASTDDRY